MKSKKDLILGLPSNWGKLMSSDRSVQVEFDRRLAEARKMVVDDKEMEDMLDTFADNISNIDYDQMKRWEEAGVDVGDLSLDELINMIRANVYDVLVDNGLIDGFSDPNETDMGNKIASIRDKKHLEDES